MTGPRLLLNIASKNLYIVSRYQTLRRTNKIAIILQTTQLTQTILHKLIALFEAEIGMPLEHENDSNVINIAQKTEIC